MLCRVNGDTDVKTILETQDEEKVSSDKEALVVVSHTCENKTEPEV